MQGFANNTNRLRNLLAIGPPRNLVATQIETDCGGVKYQWFRSRPKLAMSWPLDCLAVALVIIGQLLNNLRLTYEIPTSPHPLIRP